MSARLILLAGPAGGGKSEIARRMIEDEEADFAVEYTALWAAMRTKRRGPDGKYPVRKDDDPFVTDGFGSRLKDTATRQALRDGFAVVVTTSSSVDTEKWKRMADAIGSSFTRRVVDPGREVVIERLSDADGNLSDECEGAVRRWYR